MSGAERTTSAEGVDPKAFRQAMGRFATGVALITARVGEEVAVITVNSLTSVSLKPPIILWCLDDAASRYTHFAAAETFGVSILSEEQRSLSDQFARSPAPFASANDLVEFAGGVPVFAGALAQLSCRSVDRRTLGDHLVIAGLVEGSALTDGAPLAYFAGRYAAITPPVS